MQYNFDLLDFSMSTETLACPTPGPVRHGSVLTWGGNLLVEFVCDEGFFPMGDVFGACIEEEGAWTIDTPICVGQCHRYYMTRPSL